MILGSHMLASEITSKIVQLSRSYSSNIQFVFPST